MTSTANETSCSRPRPGPADASIHTYVALSSRQPGLRVGVFISLTEGSATCRAIVHCWSVDKGGYFPLDLPSSLVSGYARRMVGRCSDDSDSIGHD